MGNKVKLVCEICGKNFEREKREHKRNQKIGRKTYCSRSCSGKGNVINFPNGAEGDTSKLMKGSQKDEFSPFRYHLRKAKSRNKKFNLTLKDLKDVWDKQNGICPYTGIQLVDWDYKAESNSLYTASLDRIDSSKGYFRENIQFVSKNINYMKNNLSHQETIDLCKIISNYWK
jgi:hypothetical protein